MPCSGRLWRVFNSEERRDKLPVHRLGCWMLLATTSKTWITAGCRREQESMDNHFDKSGNGDQNVGQGEGAVGKQVNTTAAQQVTTSLRRRMPRATTTRPSSIWSRACVSAGRLATRQEKQ